MPAEEPPQPRDPVAPGDVVSQKYRVERVVGRGGMGVVVEAVHLALEERVALKLLRPHVLEKPGLIARFEREARAAARLKGERVGRVRDVGTTEQGVPYMVMDYLEGEDLGARLERDVELPVVVAVDLAIQACHALAEAHQRGVVHRDIKPENLFLVQTGSITGLKVLDFGISKLLGPESGSMQQTSEILGTPYYMAPEQMRHTASVDARADVYSLGAVLFEMLTGRRPFEAQSFPELAALVLRERPPSAGSFRPDVPSQLSAVVDRCLEKEPRLRYASVADLALALHPFASPRGQREAEQIADLVRTESQAPTLAGGLAERPSLVETLQIAPTLTSAPSMVSDPPTAAPAPRRRWWLVPLAAAALLGGGAFGLSLREPPAPTSAAAAPRVEPSAPPVAAEESTPRAAAAPSESAGAKPSAEPVAPVTSAAGDSSASGTGTPPRNAGLAPRGAGTPRPRPEPAPRPAPSPLDINLSR